MIGGTGEPAQAEQSGNRQCWFPLSALGIESKLMHVGVHSPTATTPIIMLTVKSDESDIVRGLEVGADDSVTKTILSAGACCQDKGATEDQGTNS